jgi:hypothetical protein
MYAEEGTGLWSAAAPWTVRCATGEILEVRRADGTPPYLVRWSDDGHEAHVVTT